jgi:hypothetical protein
MGNKGMRFDVLPPVTKRQKAAAKGGKATKAAIGKTSTASIVSARIRRQAAAIRVRRG